MPKIQLDNPLSFANFISCTDHSTLIFDHRGELVDAQTQEPYADFSDADFAVGINFPPRIVSVHSCSFYPKGSSTFACEDTPQPTVHLAFVEV